MKLIHKSINHQCIGLPYETIESRWIISMEEEDFNGDQQMLERFSSVTIEQRNYINPDFKVKGDNIHQWFKGTRTITFGHPTKDKQKKQIIRMTNDFILANNDTLNVDWKPINFYEQ